MYLQLHARRLALAPEAQIVSDAEACGANLPIKEEVLTPCARHLFAQRLLQRHRLNVLLQLDLVRPCLEQQRPVVRSLLVGLTGGAPELHGIFQAEGAHAHGLRRDGPAKDWMPACFQERVPLTVVEELVTKISGPAAYGCDRSGRLGILRDDLERLTMCGRRRRRQRLRIREARDDSLSGSHDGHDRRKGLRARSFLCYSAPPSLGMPTGHLRRAARARG